MLSLILQRRLCWKTRLSCEILPRFLFKVFKRKQLNMPIENSNSKIWGYFKRGDIVKDSPESVWKDTKFEIISFSGNAYCPILVTKIHGYNRNGNSICNLDAKNARLYSSVYRPFRSVKKQPLLKLLAKGNTEARREFKIRVNTKTL